MQRPRFARLLAAGLLAALGAGCATTGLTDAQELALYQAHAGEPVKSFTVFGQLNGWSPLGDAALAVWARPSEAYLLELTGAASIWIRRRPSP